MAFSLPCSVARPCCIADKLPVTLQRDPLHRVHLWQLLCSPCCWLLFTLSTVASASDLHSRRRPSMLPSLVVFAASTSQQHAHITLAAAHDLQLWAKLYAGLTTRCVAHCTCTFGWKWHCTHYSLLASPLLASEFRSVQQPWVQSRNLGMQLGLAIPAFPPGEQQLMSNNTSCLCVAIAPRIWYSHLPLKP